jgi:hypothetical protein
LRGESGDQEAEARAVGSGSADLAAAAIGFPITRSPSGRRNCCPNGCAGTVSKPACPSTLTVGSLAPQAVSGRHQTARVLGFSRRSRQSPHSATASSLPSTPKWRACWTRPAGIITHPHRAVLDQHQGRAAEWASITDQTPLNRPGSDGGSVLSGGSRDGSVFEAPS